MAEVTDTMGSSGIHLGGACGHGQSSLSTLGPDSRVVVVGLGVTGVSALNFLHRRGIECVALDTRENPPGLAAASTLSRVPVFTGGLRADCLTWATHLLVSPGIGLEQAEIRAALEHGAALISDIDLFADQVRAPVIGVTGSNGKSTVVTLVAEMAQEAGLKVRAGGNLGTPVLDLLDEACQLYVLELSSFQLERSRRLRPEAGAVLNVSPDHLDRHSNQEAYAEAKGRLLRWSRRQVVNGDDPVVTRLAGSALRDRQLRFSLSDPSVDYGLLCYRGREWLAAYGKPLIPAAEMRLSGRHNWANALAALALAETAGISPETAISVLRRFSGLPHRMQMVGEIDGVAWINDSKATNVGAAEAAIAGSDAPLIWLAGGDGKGADFASLVPAVAAKVKTAVLYGRDRNRLAETLAGATEIRVVEDLSAAMTVAGRIARPGDTVLLAPACASLDQFENYQARGECFMQWVRNLVGRAEGGRASIANEAVRPSPHPEISLAGADLGEGESKWR
ncbi:MAG: UDP-N-acetylmuramoyl-L-alanine--D-glutamate ligase [Methylothermaceae bacterium]|nr:UDP-N-acetylmuramoyl-L-alanine--D-glutamate ligase [Methylothermaceae bacterium]